MLKTLLFLCFLIYFCEGQLFKNVVNNEVLRSLIHWNQIGYDLDGIKYLNDTNKRITPGSIYFDEEIDESEIFFKQYNNVPVGFASYKDYVFITVPRRRYGIVSTLNYVDLKGGSNQLLKPYPNTKSIPDFTSVYRPRYDECERLWVVDTGLLEIPENQVQVKPPEIVIINLKTNKEILRHPIKSSSLADGITSGLTSITVDVTRDTCDDAHAYINDLATGGLIVFSLKKKDTWRFTHPSFLYDAGAMNFPSGSFNIPWMDGLFSIALSDPDRDGVRTAYYHPFVATQEFSIKTNFLKNPNSEFEKHFKLEGVRGPWSQSGSHTYHSPTRTLLFANIARDGILCWNVDKPLTPKNTALVSRHSLWLFYISDIKVVLDNVWMLVNKMPQFIYGTLNPEENNFSLTWAKISDLINGTVCDTKNDVK